MKPDEEDEWEYRRPTSAGASQKGDNNDSQAEDEEVEYRRPTPVGSRGSNNTDSDNGEQGNGNQKTSNNTYDFLKSGLSEAEAKLKEKYSKRKIIGFWQQLAYLLLHSPLRKITLLATILVSLLLFGTIFLGLLCDLWIGLLILLLWPILIGFAALKFKFKITKVPKFHKAVPVVFGKRQPGKPQENQPDPEDTDPAVVLDEGWTLYQVGDDVLGHINVNVVPVDVKFPIDNVKTAGGGYCKKVVLSFTMIIIEEAINEFLAEGGKPVEKMGAGGIVDRFDDNFAAAVKRVFAKIPLDEAQAMEESTLQAIIAETLNGLFSHPSSGTGGRDLIYKPENINPYATIPLYFLGVKLANVKISSVEPLDEIVALQLSIIKEEYEKISQVQDIDTKMYLTASVASKLKKMGVKSKDLDPTSIWMSLLDTEDIQNGARPWISTKAVLGSSFRKGTSGIKSVDFIQTLQDFMTMDQTEIEGAMKRMEDTLVNLGYQQKKGSKKGGRK